MKFKVGQKVRCVKGEGGAGCGWELGKVFTIKRAEIYKPWDNASRYYDRNGIYVFEDHLELATKTIEDVDYTDIIESEDGKRKVLGRINDLVFVSISNDFDETGLEHTIAELKNLGYRIVQEEVEEDKEVEDAIKVLEKAGKLKDGKILED